MTDTPYIHPSAVIDQGAHIGQGCRIWHFVHVSEGARLGTHCILGQNVFIGRDVHIGNSVKIQNNVSVYAGVTIEDHVFLGPSCVFTNVLQPRAFIEQKQGFGQTLVERGATVGANATILCGHKIGRFAMIGAGAVVTHDVTAYALMVGMPARQVGWVCRCGKRVDHQPTDTSDACNLHS